MASELVEATTPSVGSELVERLMTNCGRPNSSASVQSSTGSAVGRLLTYNDSDGATSTILSVNEKGTLDTPAASTRISFDMIGVTGVTEEMLRELYEAFDVHQRGGVERGVMREMMLSGFSNYGAPCSEKCVDRLFEHATPFHIRRHLRKGEDDEDLMSFNEFCVLFLMWLRI